MITDISHRSRITAIASSKDYLISGTIDGEIIVWAFPSLKKVKTLFHESNRVISIHFSRDFKYFITFCESGILKVWELKSFNCLNSIQAHVSCRNYKKFEKSGIKFTEDCSKIITWADLDMEIKIWEFPNLIPLISFNDHLKPIYDLGLFDPPWDTPQVLGLELIDQDTLLYGCEFGPLIYRDINTGKILDYLYDPKAWLEDFIITSDKKKIVQFVTEGGPALCLWDVNKKEISKSLYVDKNYFKIYLFHDDKYIFCVGYIYHQFDTIIYIHEIETLELIKELEIDEHTAFCLGSDYTFIVYGLMNKKLKIKKLSDFGILFKHKNI